jgi:hypothetical protein
MERDTIVQLREELRLERAHDDAQRQDDAQPQEDAVLQTEREVSADDAMRQLLEEEENERRTCERKKERRAAARHRRRNNRRLAAPTEGAALADTEGAADDSERVHVSMNVSMNVSVTVTLNVPMQETELELAVTDITGITMTLNGVIVPDEFIRVTRIDCVEEAGAASNPEDAGAASNPEEAGAASNPEEAGAASNPEEADFNECAICMSHVSDAALLHGTSVHMCVCRSCAMHFAIGTPCPMCRLPVERVVAVF